MSFPVEVGKRVGLAVLVAGMVVVAALVAGTVLTGTSGVPASAQHPAYAPDELVPDRLEATGTPDPSGDVGTVVIDQTRGNRFDREDVGPLVDAITGIGGEVRFPPPNADMATTLAEADVLVVIDPASEYDRTDVEAIRQFLDRGGRLVIFGEPNRREVQQNQVGAVLTVQRSRLTTLASSFGISFGTQYLYDQQHNDGNFKNVLVGPPEGVSDPLVEGVEDVALDTATSVTVANGTVLLRTAATAERGGTTQEAGYPVAALTGGGSVLAVGDTGFLEPGFASVGDNDVFIARIVEFMAGAGAQEGNASLGRSAGAIHPEPEAGGDHGEPTMDAALAGFAPSAAGVAGVLAAPGRSARPTIRHWWVG